MKTSPFVAEGVKEEGKSGSQSAIETKVVETKASGPIEVKSENIKATPVKTAMI
jgi:hypothetical protein